MERKQGLSLGSTEFAIVEDRLTGERRIVKGPCMFFPGPHEDANRGAAVSLSRIEYLIVEDCFLFSELQTLSLAALSLQLLLLLFLSWLPSIRPLKDQLTGDKKVVKGPAVWFPGPYERSSAKTTAIALQEDEYIKVKDTCPDQIIQRSS